MEGTSPCYRCTRRETGCHGRCESYKTYRAAQESAREKRHIVQEYDMAYDLYRRGRYPAIRRFGAGGGIHETAAAL